MYPTTSKPSSDKTLNLITKVTYYLGLLPKVGETKPNTFRTVAICLLYIVCASYIAINKEFGGFIATISNVGVIIFTIWQLNYRKYNEVQQLFIGLHTLTPQIPHLPENMQTRYKIYIIGHFIGWFLSIMGTRYIWSHFDIELSFNEVVLFDNIFMSYVQCVIILMWYIWDVIKRSYIELNRMIEQLDITLYQADRLIVLHSSIIGCVALINDIFGGMLFLITLEEVASILNAIYIDIIVSDENTSKPVLHYLFLFWTFCITIQGVVVATMCEKVVDEGKKTITISYKALYRYSNIPAIREKLFILAHQATARCPQFSAAGFFNVDFAMLFTFVNLITTYVIVIIQFSGNKK